MKRCDSKIEMQLGGISLAFAIRLISSTGTTSWTESVMGTGMTIGTRIGTIIRRAVTG